MADLSQLSDEEIDRRLFEFKEKEKGLSQLSDEELDRRLSQFEKEKPPTLAEVISEKPSFDISPFDIVAPIAIVRQSGRVGQAIRTGLTGYLRGERIAGPTLEAWLGKRETTGKELLGAAGVEEPGFFSGLAAEIATDPLTFIGGAGGVRIGARLFGKLGQKATQELGEQIVSQTAKRVPGGLAPSDDFWNSLVGKEFFEAAEKRLAGQIELPFEEQIAFKGLRKATQEEIQKGFSLIPETAIEAEAKVSNTVVSQLARKAGITKEELLNVAEGEIFSQEKIVAARQMIATAREELAQLAKLAKDRPELRGQLRDATATFYQMVTNVRNVGTRAGRAVNAFNIAATPIEAVDKAILKVMKLLDGDQLAKFQDIVSRNVGDPDALIRAVREFAPSTLGEKMAEFVGAAFVTKPTTQFRNIIGNTVAATLAVPERFLAATIDAGKAVLTGKPREIFFREGVEQAIGMIEGIKDGSRAFIRAIQDESFSTFRPRLEEVSPTRVPAIKGITGKVIRTPFRFLGAFDELFLSINRIGAARAEAFRVARTGAKSADDVISKFKNLLENPNKQILKAGQREAAERTFKEDLNGFLGFLNSARKYPAVRIVIPFFRTPVNLVRFQLRRSPAAFLTKSFREGMKKGGVEQSEALAKMFLGSTVMAALTFMALEGNITGDGPKSRTQKDILRQAGWRPNSIFVNGRYVPFQGLDPISFFLKSAADIAENFKNVGREPDESKIADLLQRFGKNIVDTRFFTDIGDIMDVVSGSQNVGARFAQRFLASRVVPNIFAGAARAIDPIIRQPGLEPGLGGFAKGVGEAVQARIPFLSKGVRPRLTEFGEPLKTSGTPFETLFSPVITSPLQEDPTIRELARLNVGIPRTGKKLAGVELSPDERNELISETGGPLKRILDQVVSSKEFQKSSDKIKIQILGRAIGRIRSGLRRQALGKRLSESEEFRQRFLEVKEIPDPIPFIQ
tara:strand:+ start:1818 stop:4721 length:2904 start_codon:yes stop_codon:yes gene_type:complete